jgi:adenylosuccinate synthase
MGIVKFPYMTRVGKGDFPTELGGKASDLWCNGGKENRDTETEAFPNATVNDTDEFSQGVAFRQAGDEYGATTGRPRRVGWLDLPLLRNSLRHGSNNVILTKLDVLNECETIKICTSYIYRGEDYQYGGGIITNGSIINEAILDEDIIKYCEPEYLEFPGWEQSLETCKDWADLPRPLKVIINFVSEATGMTPRMISIGPKPEETIFM